MSAQPVRSQRLLSASSSFLGRASKRRGQFRGWRLTRWQSRYAWVSLGDPNSLGPIDGHSRSTHEPKSWCSDGQLVAPLPMARAMARAATGRHARSRGCPNLAAGHARASVAATTGSEESAPRVVVAVHAHRPHQATARPGLWRLPVCLVAHRRHGVRQPGRPAPTPSPCPRSNGSWTRSSASIIGSSGLPERQTGGTQWPQPSTQPRPTVVCMAATEGASRRASWLRPGRRAQPHLQAVEADLASARSDRHA